MSWDLRRKGHYFLLKLSLISMLVMQLLLIFAPPYQQKMHCVFKRKQKKKKKYYCFLLSKLNRNIAIVVASSLLSLFLFLPPSFSKTALVMK